MLRHMLTVCSSPIGAWHTPSGQKEQHGLRDNYPLPCYCGPCAAARPAWTYAPAILGANS